MKKNIVICLIFIILITTIINLFYKKSDDSLNMLNDTSSFISEYESVNKMLNGENEFLELDLNSDVVIYKKTTEEIAQLINSEDDSFLVYFGFSTCPWCRNMISTLLDVAAANETSIYYVDILDVRNEFTIVNNTITESKKGSDGYYELLEILDVYLDDHYISHEGEKHNTGYKRIYGPTTLSIINGEVGDLKVGTLNDVEDPYVKLSEDQYLELYEELDALVKKINRNTCSLSSC